MQLQNGMKRYEKWYERIGKAAKGYKKLVKNFTQITEIVVD